MRLQATEAVWHVTDAFFRKMAPRGRETVALWYGVEEPGRHIAVAIGLPRAESQDYNFAIPSGELERLSLEAVPRGLVVVAQLHAHPGRSTTHSDHDNENAVSFHPGFISVVLPHYGREGLDIMGCGVHEYDGSQWRKLPAIENAKRIQVVPTVLDQ